MRPSQPRSRRCRSTCRRASSASPSVLLPPALESLGEPHVKHLVGKLWELRLKGRDGIARALYVTATGRRVVVVRAFVKKSQKTPPAEIELALRRAKGIA
ncbi:type II toxin-antitoxin system RelE/ParE family toxin [Bradyrhizobium sp. 2S1]|uniref:type II toxin-antitoxin system RelE/ParE family toxin n=1 Tax=Bradyrhizobium sp. 2S1 TaxID=1404429 RepID=UPI00289665C3|nr:type II toxin-antitoxin system RelE/ParE family toxin [Bradyrhizobium sp. 2S1]